MITPIQVAHSYIALWNEHDGDRRLATLANAWSADAIYCDPIMRGEGYEEISALIGAAQERFRGLNFSLIGSPDGHGNFARFSWGLGPQSGDAVVKGTDFVVLEGDRIVSVTGFLDLIPTE